MAENGRNPPPSKIWTFGFLAAISLSRIGIGLFQSITGPTLPVLSQNVATDPQRVSWMFTGRAIGLLLGSILAPGLSKACDHMLQLALSLGIIGICTGVVPILTDFWLLVVIVTLGGVIVGFNDALIQSILLRVWGEDKSASYLQMHHFTYSVGAFLAPLVVAPFYESSAEDLCDSENNQDGEVSNEILTPYLICAGFIGAVTIYMFFLYFKDVISKISTSHEDTIDIREEDRLGTLIWYFIPLTFFYFAIVGGEATFYSNIFSYATCAVNLDPSSSSKLNALFWAGFGIGRGGGIIGTRFIKNSYYILGDCFGILVATICFVILSDNEKMLWAMTFLYGFAIATLYSCGMSYTHKLSNMSSTWIFIFGVGNTIGAMSMQPIGTMLVFSDDPLNFMWLLTGLSLTALLSFIGMYLLGYKYGPLPQVRKKRDERNSIEKNQVKPEDFSEETSCDL